MHLLPGPSSPRGGGQEALPGALARLLMGFLDTERQIGLLEMTRFQSGFFMKKGFKGIGKY